jgi:phosphatidylglycerol:prolipoprotein diacylglycerol transferase
VKIFQPTYVLFVGAGLLLALLFPVTKHIRNPKLRQQYYLMQVITIIGAVVGAKLSVLVGDYHWPWVPIKDWQGTLWSGRSITGALLFGFLFAEIAKPIVGYTMPPNDRFAALLPFTIGLGRFGCLTAGCCGGLPCDSWCAMPGLDGVPRYPTQLIEIIFQFSIGILFIFMVKRKLLFGRLFSFYLIVYGVFRFLTEFIRDTPKFFGPYSGYQLISLVMITAGAVFFLKRTFAPPAGWNEFRNATAAGQSAQPTLEVSHV